MFLNLSPSRDDSTGFMMCPPGSKMENGVCVPDPSTYGPSVLIDQNVNYYGFLESKEHDNWMKSIEGQMLTSDIYESPYFGTMPSGAYRELDRVYEAYKISLDAFIDPKESENFGGGISPALILAAAAAFFFAG